MQLTKNKMYLNNQKIKNHPPSLASFSKDPKNVELTHKC